ncbi:MAG TPA: thioesterase family protein [Mycobacteriales bacterium]|nr:thioesterase family protein [Mycobacteriales bacterium]
MFTHETRVRFGDTDAMGHVNNAAFSSYLEDARVGFFLAVSGSTITLAGLILARTEIDFVRPILFGTGPVRTTTWVEDVGTKSFRMGYTMEQDGEVVARAASVQVAYDYAAGASRALTDDERAVLAAHRRDA